MTNLATIQLKMIQALLETIDAEDAKDAERAIRMIRDLVEPKAGATS